MSKSSKIKFKIRNDLDEAKKHIFLWDFLISKERVIFKVIRS